MRILIFGKNGQVGSRLTSDFANLGASKKVEVQSLGRNECDINKKDQVRKVIDQYEPDFIINATAYTAVDQAENDYESAFKINSESVLEIAKMASARGIWLVHYSTDYVFDGSKVSPYKESDATEPTGVYGASKLQGEKNIIETHSKYIILRTSWVYGEHGNNFPKTILNVAQKRGMLKIVDDQIGIPTYTGFISNITYKIIQHLIKNNKESLSGVYHLTSQGNCSWYEFAKFFIESAYDNGLQLKCDTKNILPIRSQDYPTQARRPMYSVLNTTKIVNTFHIKIPDWRSDAKTFIQNYVHGDMS